MAGFEDAIPGIITAVVSSGIDWLNREFGKAEGEKMKKEAREAYDQDIAGIREGVHLQGQELDDYRRARESVDVAKEINDFIRSYEPSKWNEYLTKEATQSTMNLAADQGLLESQRGRQMIQNSAALAAGSGLEKYINTAIGRRANLENQELQSLGMKTNLTAANATNEMNALNARYGYDMNAYQNYMNAVYKPTVATEAANYGVKSALDQYLPPTPVANNTKTATKPAPQAGPATGEYLDLSRHRNKNQGV